MALQVCEWRQNLGGWTAVFDFRWNGLRSYKTLLPGETAPTHPWSTHSRLVLLSSCAELLGVCLLPEAYGDTQRHLPCCPCLYMDSLMLSSSHCPYQQGEPQWVEAPTMSWLVQKQA